MEIPDALASGWSFEAVGHTDTDNAWDIVAATVAKRDIKSETRIEWKDRCNGDIDGRHYDGWLFEKI